MPPSRQHLASPDSPQATGVAAASRECCRTGGITGIGRALLRAPLVVAAVALLAACAAEMPRAVQYQALPTAERPLVITNVALFAGDTTGVVPNQDVWIQGETILRVTAAGSIAPPRQAQVLDGTGRTLLPGLIDAHVHVESTARPPWKPALPNPEANLQRFLYAGITTVMDLGGPLGVLADLQAELNRGELTGPDLYFTGPHVAMAGGHPASLADAYAPWPINLLMRKRLSFQVEDGEDVDAAIEAIREAGGRLVKVTVDDIPVDAPHLGEELLQRAVDGAHAAGYQVAAHIGTNEDARMAVAAGADLLVHNVYREPIAPETVSAVAAAGIPVAPTIGVFHSFDRLAHEGPEEPTEFMQALMAPAILDAIRNPPEDFVPEELASWMEAAHGARQDRLDNARALYAAGVTILAGSDSPVAAWPAGAALHRELDYLVEAGIPPAAVLQAATRNNARAYGFADRGVIAPGKRADLLLVDGDPTADIAAVHRVAVVVRAGKPVERTAPYGGPAAE